MDRTKLIRKSEFEWVIEPMGTMRVPAVTFPSTYYYDRFLVVSRRSESLGPL